MNTRMKKVMQYLTPCCECGARTTLAHARQHGGMCKSCSMRCDRATAERVSSIVVETASSDGSDYDIESTWYDR